MILTVDSLVQYLQLIYDGDILGWSCFHDPDEDIEERLC